MVGVFVHEVLEQKPENIIAFCGDFFTRPDLYAMVTLDCKRLSILHTWKKYCNVLSMSSLATTGFNITENGPSRAWGKEAYRVLPPPLLRFRPQGTAAPKRFAQVKTKSEERDMIGSRAKLTFTSGFSPK